MTKEESKGKYGKAGSNTPKVIKETNKKREKEMREQIQKVRDFYRAKKDA